MALHLELGRKGEAVARSYLEEQAYALLHVNWKSGRWEVDIVAAKDGLIIFVEVKTLMGEQGGWPEQAVTSQKEERLRKVAAAYLEVTGIRPLDIRFDIIAITYYDAGHYALLHMEDAF
ncbi:YraN family protein [Chitinophaga pendula]|uniref:YraN family protein n=1 Tax=Chitinophaga TaxID=79328 RepID=UPI000BAF0DDF|nr:MULTISPECIES: YraN family protein [Chitinophaga]ASZ12912.1 endonuclease [Chitinophaga sp. MD30]UCJ09459.1 YraN family protein [Chitinophaga pendula]